MKPWQVDIERLLMKEGSPTVLTTPMLATLAGAAWEGAPSQASITRWLAQMVEVGKLQPVIRGVYLNRLGHRDISAAAAAPWIRTRSVVSLSWVLEQAQITNNFGDTITCVIPIEQGWANPQIGDRSTQAGMFRFFAMPARLVDERAGRLEDIRDLRFDYPRATPEKAFLDWLVLGDSPRSRMTRPPYDLDLRALDARRLHRLVKSMAVEAKFAAWVEAWERYQQAEDVQENSAPQLRL